MHGIVIHGGAGVVPARLSPERYRQHETSLAEILDRTFQILEEGGSSLDAVTAAVCMLEDDPLYNAGCGAGLTQDGTAELDASIMDGRTEKSGAVACVTRVKNPIVLARQVMEQSRHVMLVGTGAEEFALERGLVLVPNRYFRTDERRRELAREQAGEHLVDQIASKQGTVGAVALDRAGDLAAATSTGGTSNKMPGRVGDSPIIGAGTYAKNGVCAVSATGQGEYFVRSVAAHHIACAVEYRGLSLQEATVELVHKVLPRLGGLGGVIAISSKGEIAMTLNTQGMFRGARHSEGHRCVAIAA